VTHAVQFDDRAARDLADIPANGRRRIIGRIAGLESDPRPSGSQELKGDLRGVRRLRVGAYRVSYTVDDEHNEVWVRSIGHRSKFYDQATRRKR
jgi:mRNA interferase RelE/StbE